MVANSPDLSIVSTLYGSSATVEEFIRTHYATAQSLVGDKFEIVLVNDGSPDDSLKKAIGLSKKYPNLKLIDLSRNFGHHKALLTGMRAAQGQYVYICDSDMEEPPSWLEKYWALMHSSDGAFDLVGGVQEQRKRGLMDIMTAGLSWRVFSYLSETELKPNLVTARLMTKKYNDAVISYPEKSVFLATLCSDVGFQQTFIPLEKYLLSETTYSFKKKVRLWVDGVTAFSTKPLYLAVLFSGALGAFGVLLLGMTFYKYFTLKTLPGWASQMSVLSIIFSALFFVLAIQGLYIGRIFKEVRNRPQTIIKQVIQEGKSV